MNKSEYLLTQFASECMEVAHRVTKALQFGLGEIQPGQELTNAQRILEEYGDLVGVMTLLQTQGVLSIDYDRLQFQTTKKIVKVHEFMEYARKQGTLT